MWRPAYGAPLVRRTIPADKGFELLGRHRAGEEVALHFVTAFFAQEGQLLSGLDAFGDGLHPETAGQTDDRFDNRFVVRVTGNVAHKGLVDLELVYLEAVSYTHLDVYKRQLPPPHECASALTGRPP